MLDRPEVKPEDLPYLDGYRALDGGRTSGGFGPNPITVTDALAYLTLVDESRAEERMKFLRLMQKLDRVFLTHMAEQAQKPNE